MYTVSDVKPCDGLATLGNLSIFEVQYNNVNGQSELHIILPRFEPAYLDLVGKHR